jgi:hypothetical protein
MFFIPSHGVFTQNRMLVPTQSPAYESRTFIWRYHHYYKTLLPKRLRVLYYALVVKNSICNNHFLGINFFTVGYEGVGVLAR